MSNTYKNRINMFDFAKGIAMILIFSVDTLYYFDFFRNSIGMWFWVFITYPGTAALFLVMGYWYQPKSMKNLFKELWMSGIKIYLYTALITIIAIPLLSWMDNMPAEMVGRNMLATFLAFLLGFQSSYMGEGFFIADIGTMWYVLVYIIGILILNLFYSIGLEKGKKILPGLLFILSLIGMYFGVTNVNLPFCIVQVLVAVQVLYYGYMLRENGFMNRKWNGKDWIVLAIGCLITLGIFYGLSMIPNYGMEDLFTRECMLFAIPAGIILLRICQAVQKREFAFCNWINAIGNKSIIIMALLTIDKLACNWMGLCSKSFMPKNDIANAFIILIIRIVIYTAIILLLPVIRQKIAIMKEAKKQKKAEN